MLFDVETRRRIAAGEVTLAFRRWTKPTVRAGGTLRTPVGVLAIDAVDKIDAATITDADARAAGHADSDAVRAALERFGRADGATYRIAFHTAGADPRIALRDTTAGLDDVRTRLDRLDAASRRGPWTGAVLALIAERPGVRAADLQALLGWDGDLASFKRAVRRLKELGLTESLPVGYRLSPRGEALRRGH